MTTLTSGRLAVALVSLGIASCFLPSEPSERITFELISPLPFRVPLGQTKWPVIRVLVGDRALSDPAYRFVVDNRNIVRVDGSGQALYGVTRGQSVVRVVYIGSTGTVDTTFSAHVVVSNVSVSPLNVTLRRIGETVQMTARADSWDSTQPGANVPQSAFTWSSENPAIATVSSTGLVTAVDDGDIRITAKLDDIEGQAYVGVLQAASAVRVLPEVDTLRTVGRSTRFSAVALDSTGAVLSGAKPRWTSSNTRVARIDQATGVATADSAGTTLIVGRVGLAADTATLVVKQVVRLLFVRPGLDTLTAIQDTGRIVASAVDSALQAIPDFVVDSWTSDDPSIATVDASGLVTAQANGIVLVTARSGGESAFATFLVRQQVARIQIVEEAVTLNGAGAAAQLTATATDKNGFPVPAAGALDWRSHFGLVATVDANGLVTAQGNGRTTVSVSVAGHSGAVAVTVTGAPQELIAFESPNGIEAIRTDGTLRTLLIPNTSSGEYCYYAQNYNCSTSATDPAWSPGGTRLAYSLSTYDNGSCYYGCADVYSSWPDGSDAINLTGGASYNNDPAWSPDGTRIAFATGRAMGPGIFVMNADGSNVRRVTTQGGANPKWSPDGTRIVFENNSEIHVVNADGTGLVNVTNHTAHDFQPAWSPDGVQIAFVSNRGGDHDLWLMNVDGTGLTNLTGGLAFPGAYTHAHEYTPAWSPDGQRLALSSQVCSTQTDDYGYEFTSCASVALYTVNRDGTGLQALNAAGVNPAWHAAGSLSPAPMFKPTSAARIRR